jgi:hypothetical protein
MDRFSHDPNMLHGEPYKQQLIILKTLCKRWQSPLTCQWVPDTNLCAGGYLYPCGKVILSAVKYVGGPVSYGHDMRYDERAVVEYKFYYPNNPDEIHSFKTKRHGLRHCEYLFLVNPSYRGDTVKITPGTEEDKKQLLAELGY